MSKEVERRFEPDAVLGHLQLESRWLIDPRAARALEWKLHQLQRAHFDMSVFYGPAKPDFEAARPNRLDRLLDDVVEYRGSRAIVPIVGSLMKYQPPSSFFGVRGMTYGDIAAMVQALGDDSRVDEIWLDIDSPGGTVAGVQECGDMIFEVAQSKTVKAFCNDMACSAAYWLASQANEVYANEAAEVGCIGVYTVLLDSTEADSMLGFKRHIVTSGGVKGLGGDGAVTDELIAEVQREVDELQAIFTAAIARGREISNQAAANLGDGQVYIGQSAVDRGLIDGIMSVREIYQNGGNTVSKETRETPIAETPEYQKLVAEVEAEKEKRKAAEAENARLRDRELQAAEAVDIEAINQFVEYHVAKGNVLPKHEQALAAFLHECRATQCVVGEGTEAGPLYAMGLLVLNDVLSAERPNYVEESDGDGVEAERSKSGYNTPGAAKTKARQMLADRGINLKEVSDDGSNTV